MPAKDKTHDLVRRLLESSGWRITHDPYSLKCGERDLTIDLGAQDVFAAESAGRKIAVEVKSFVGRSDMTELEKAIGQIVIYRRLLRNKEPERTLFLAIPSDVYERLLNNSAGREICDEAQLNLLIYDGESEVLTQWIEL